ncbi:MAG: FGGY-family carbohydrate kinase [Bacilli bacterium]|nr:FGGY-family carbohydrate kinase [Bacilli bacterium]
MKQKLFLTIDVGTQSVRVSFINPKGEILGLEQVKYTPPYFSKAPGFAEINPDDYMKYIGTAYRHLIGKKNLIDDVIGVAITYFRDSVVISKDDMVPLRPAILWLDQRRARGDEKLPLFNRMIFKLVGMSELIRLNRIRTPAHWLKENEPAIWEQTTRYMNISTYINYKFTGEYKDSNANCIGHMPIDYKHRRWCKNNHNLTGMIYGVDVNTLCEMIPPDIPIGRINKEASQITGIKAGLPFYAVGSDKGCETFGLGAFNNNVGALSFGTSATIQTTNKRYVTPQPLFPAYPSVVSGYYNTETMINKGYWMLTWFIKNFCEKETEIAKKNGISPEEELNKYLKKVPVGSQGLLIQPFWGPTLTKPLARGNMVGFMENHSKYHVYRAIIEGIDYELKEGLEAIEKRQKKKVTSLMISGGGSQSDEICQIAADIFNVPVSKIQTYETSSLGAAMAGFVAMKEFPSPEEAVKNMVKITKTFDPIPKNVELYKYYYKQYRKLYPALKKPIADITLHDEALGI